MRLSGIALVIALAGCAVAPGYRDTSVPITSIAAFDPARFAGLWHEVARYPVEFQAGCGAATLEVTRPGDGTLQMLNRCATAAGERRTPGRARPSGPGRLDLRLDGAAFEGGYWVLWVDESYRTAVIGQPSGRAGWILNRDPVIPADRLRAAREILEWNGYDLGRLVMVLQ